MDWLKRLKILEKVLLLLRFETEAVEAAVVIVHAQVAATDGEISVSSEIVNEQVVFRSGLWVSWDFRGGWGCEVSRLREVKHGFFRGRLGRGH